MNDICKDYLMHSWGKSPESKKNEQTYNAKYYSENKQKWVINRQKRRNMPLGPAIADDIVMGIASYLKDENGKPDVSGYAKRGLAALNKIFKRTVTSISNLPKSIKNVKRWIESKQIFGLPVRLIKKTKVATDAKRIFEIFKENKNNTYF